jgi:hypothetical protein
MKSRTFLVALGAVAGMLLVAPGTASANVSWCISDPPVHVVSPGGAHLTVNNMIWLPESAKHLKHQVWDEASAQPDGSGGTFITVTVHLPDAVPAHVVSTEHRFNVSTEADGQTAIVLYLDVPTP